MQETQQKQEQEHDPPKVGVEIKLPLNNQLLSEFLLRGRNDYPETSETTSPDQQRPCALQATAATMRENEGL